MEFPNLGKHCTVKSCNKLDFLPMICDACSKVFCNDHFLYIKHSCNEAYQKDVQVPVCPLCNAPVPSKRGEQPDIAVGEHIDRDCQADPAISKRKIYTNKCSVRKCRQKEFIRLTCNDCNKSYCLKHRHPDDHNCDEQKMSPAQAACVAALARAQTSRKSNFNWFRKQKSLKDDSRQVVQPLPEVSVTSSVQGSMSEDEALALALHKSLNDGARNAQEHEDRLLAQALARCDEEGPQRSQAQKEKTCCLS